MDTTHRGEVEDGTGLRHGTTAPVEHPGPRAVGHNGGQGDDTAVASSRPPFATGDLFAGRYRMVTRVGGRGTGEVWRADDLVLGVPVALKVVVRPARQSSRDQLLREVRVTRQITHPSVCRLFDVGEADGVPFYSMEFVGGGNLATLLTRTGRLPSERVVEIAHQLCAGLAAAHAQGILHGDLTSGKILLDDGGQVRITGFGRADATSDTRAQSTTGTSRSLPPEHPTPGTSRTARTDVYALGAVLYELVTGLRHHGPSSAAAGPPLPSPLAPAISPALERAILSAIAPNPDVRPATVGALAAALPRIDSIRRTGRPPSSARQSRRTAWWLAGAAAAALLASSAALSPQRGVAEPARDAAVRWGLLLPGAR